MLKRKQKWNKHYFVVGLILFLGFIYFIQPLLKENSRITPITSVIKQIGINTILDNFFLPLNEEINRIEKNFTDQTDDQSRKSLQNQVANLKKQLQVKDNLINFLNHLKVENENLRNLLNFRSNINYSVVPSQVISYEPLNHFYFFWIGSGKNQFLSNQMPIITFNQQGEQGLVGFIVNAHENASLVQSILDPKTHIGVTIEGYNTKAILKGDHALEGILFVDFINNSFTNLEGKYVYTTEIGERYPQGIKVGKIISTSTSLYGLFQSAKVKPVIDFASIRDVFVITPTESLQTEFQ